MQGLIYHKQRSQATESIFTITNWRITANSKVLRTYLHSRMIIWYSISSTLLVDQILSTIYWPVHTSRSIHIVRQILITRMIHATRAIPRSIIHISIPRLPLPVHLLFGLEFVLIVNPLNWGHIVPSGRVPVKLSKMLLRRTRWLEIPLLSRIIRSRRMHFTVPQRISGRMTVVTEVSASVKTLNVGLLFDVRIDFLQSALQSFAGNTIEINLIA